MAASETRVAEADQSFERLYRTHRRDVYNFVLHDVRNPEDAEDVTQVAFLNAYRALRSGVPPEKPRAWLLTIAQNVCRRRFRKRAAHIHEVPLDAELAVSAPDDYDGPTADEILAAFRKLPANQRLALAMREIQGRPYAEIASELRITVPAVETLIFRARRGLRAELEPAQNRLRGLLALPAALPGLIAKVFGSAVSSLGRTGLVTRAAGVVGAIVLGGVAVELVPPLLAAEEPPSVEQVAPLKQIVPSPADEPKGTDARAAREAAATDAAVAGGAEGGATPLSSPLPPMPPVPDVSVPALPSVPSVSVPNVEVPEIPSVELPLTLPPPPLTLPPPPPPPLDLPDLG